MVPKPATLVPFRQDSGYNKKVSTTQKPCRGLSGFLQHNTIKSGALENCSFESACAVNISDVKHSRTFDDHLLYNRDHGILIGCLISKHIWVASQKLEYNYAALTMSLLAHILLFNGYFPSLFVAYSSQTVTWMRSKVFQKPDPCC